MKFSGIKLCCVCLLLKVAISAAELVPFFMWTNIGNDNCVPEVEIFPGETIQKLTESDYMKCLSSLHPQRVKIFVMEELDSSNLNFRRKDENSFVLLQRILASYPSIVLPAVQPPDISLFKDEIQATFQDAEVTTDELPAIDNLLAIEESDLNKFQYIAFIVVESTSQTVEYSDLGRVGRQLLATELSETVTNETTFIGTQCIYMSFTNLTLFVDKTSYNLTSPSKLSDDCSLSNTTRMVEISFLANNNQTLPVKLRLTFEKKNFPVSNRIWWFMQKADLTHSLINNNETTYSLNHTEQYTAPLGWSWVCAAPVTLTWRNNKKEIKQQLRFQNLQVQPFDITNSTFSHATDCSGILSGPIWTGTVMSLLLAAIFAFGLAMMAAVTTMDRFDDPRGKPLMVHTHETGN